MAQLTRKYSPRRNWTLLALFNLIALILIAIFYGEWNATNTFLIDQNGENSFSLPPPSAVASTSDTTGTSLSLDPPPFHQTVPSNWTLIYPNTDKNQEIPKHCLPEAVNLDPKLPRILFYHIQHHAGTNFWALARNNKECAPRACRQSHKQCLVSYSEKVEADNLRNSRLAFIPYEFMLPKHFPFPFVNEREGFFFTTIMRNPIDRLKTIFRRQPDKGQHLWNSHPTLGEDPYNIDNLSVRWLAGVTNNRPITEQDLTLAKCRLESFDLVMTEMTLDEAMTQIVCPLRNWTKCIWPGGKGAGKSDPFIEMDPVVTGAWIERQRPSFELYDYARSLSAHQLQKRYGLTASGDELLRRSYVATMEKYTNTTCTGPWKSCRRLDPYQPVSGCEEYHRIWASNQDLVPKIFGIGTFLASKRKN